MNHAKALASARAKAAKFNKPLFKREINDAIHKAGRGDDLKQLRVSIATLRGFAPNNIKEDLRKAANAAGKDDVRGVISSLSDALRGLG